MATRRGTESAGLETAPQETETTTAPLTPETEPAATPALAAPVDAPAGWVSVAEHAAPVESEGSTGTDEPEERVYDPRVWVDVYDVTTGKKLDQPVPETWLDGRFPQLSEFPVEPAETEVTPTQEGM